MRPLTIRTYEDLASYSQYSKIMGYYASISSFINNFSGVLLLLIAISNYIRTYLDIPDYIIKLSISVLTLIPFTYFQVPEDIKFLNLPSIIMLILVLVIHVVYNWFEIITERNISFPIFDSSNIITLIWVTNYQIEVACVIFNIRNSMKNRDHMSYISPMALSVLMSLKYFCGITYVMVRNNLPPKLSNGSYSCIKDFKI